MQHLSIHDDLQPTSAVVPTLKVTLPKSIFSVTWGTNEQSKGQWPGDLVLLSPLSHEAIKLDSINGVYVCMNQDMNLTHAMSTHLAYAQQFHQQYAPQFHQQYAPQHRPHHYQQHFGAISEADKQGLSGMRQCFELRAMSTGLAPKSCDTEETPARDVTTLARNTVCCAVFELSTADFLSSKSLVKEVRTPDGFYFRLECLHKEFDPSPSLSMLVAVSQELSEASPPAMRTTASISKRLLELSEKRQKSIAGFLRECGLHHQPELVQCDMYSFFGLPAPLDPTQMTGLNAALADILAPTSLVHACSAFQQELSRVRNSEASPDTALAALCDTRDARAELRRRINTFINVSVVANFDYTSDSNIAGIAQSTSNTKVLSPIMGLGENQNLAGLSQKWDLEDRLFTGKKARQALIKTGVSDSGRCETTDDIAFVETYVNSSGVKLFGDCEDNTFLQTLIHTATTRWASQAEYKSAVKQVLAQLLSTDPGSHKAISQIAGAFHTACRESANDMVAGLVLARAGYVGAEDANTKKATLNEDIQHISSAYSSAKRSMSGHAVAMDVKFTKLATVGATAGEPAQLQVSADTTDPKLAVNGQLQALADRHGVEIVKIDRQWAFHEGTALAIDKTGMGHDIVEFHLDEHACPEIRDKFLKYNGKKMDKCFAQNIMNQIRSITLKNATGIHGKAANVYDPSAPSSFYQYMMYCGPYVAVTLEKGIQGFKTEAASDSLSLECECDPSCKCSCCSSKGKARSCRCKHRTVNSVNARQNSRQNQLLAQFSKEAKTANDLSPDLLKQILERVIEKMDADIQPSSLCCGASMVLAKSASKAHTAQPYGVTQPLCAEERELLGAVARSSTGVFTSLEDIQGAMRKSKFRLINTDFVRHHPGHKVLITHPLVKIPLAQDDHWEASELQAREQFGREIEGRLLLPVAPVESFTLCCITAYRI